MDEIRAGFREMLRQLQADAGAARKVLAEAVISPGAYTNVQINAAQRVIQNAFTAADRLDIYERIDEIESILAVAPGSH